ncbi:organic cation/carnitine transporter 3-like [Glycine soja]|uniref:Organic cation/carnitine transporter 3 n=1 Tax=Glycine soja TaxID=3848 RepID=A0A445KBX4_GLYSO|nr:organic cation/carnitine transporter 3-like [Glycine soja]RZC08293.1 Organic cation/carnitine transporter 3 [Glycine soja]
MADSTPLLSQPDSSSSPDTQKPQPPPPPRNQQHPSLGSTVELCIGEFNWSQFLQSILVSLAWIFDAQQTFISVFTDAPPAWRCTEQAGNACKTANTNTVCNLPEGSWAWDGPTQASMVSDWGLECANSSITGLPASMFFAGCLLGGFLLASLADSSLGRKNMLFFSCLVMAITSFLVTFSPNVSIYSALKFLCGFARATIGTSALVLASELVGRRWRAQISVIGFFCFTIGFLSLPAMAYINRSSSWRNLYLWTSISTMLYCILVKLFVTESPRWLLVRGKTEEAVETLKCITSITQSNLNLAINNMSHEEETWNVDIFSALKILLQNKWSSRRLSSIMAMGIGIGLVYYGMPLGLQNLSFNLYLSVIFNALSELPSALIVLFFIDKFNRRITLLLFTILSGLFSVMSTVQVSKSSSSWNNNVQIVFELVSFFSACTSFNVYLIYTTELFPTCVRNSALSMARLAVVLGGMFSPLLVSAGRGNKFLCYGVFGLVIGFSGVFGIFLPETKGRAFCDSMDEEENKEKNMACGMLLA